MVEEMMIVAGMW